MWILAFQPDHLATMSVSASGKRYDTDERLSLGPGARSPGCADCQA